MRSVSPPSSSNKRKFVLKESSPWFLSIECHSFSNKKDVFDYLGPQKLWVFPFGFFYSLRQKIFTLLPLVLGRMMDGGC